MELFSKTNAVKLRSHLDKYMVADDDQETVRQSRNGSSRKARWVVERVQENKNVIRLKSCFGRYLTASDIPFLLGMTGKKVLQTEAANPPDWKVDWEPIREGVQVKLKSWCGKLLRANGGVPPWRNSITHDEPHSGATQDWIFWDVEAVEAPELESLTSCLSTISSFSSVGDDYVAFVSDDYGGSQPGSPVFSIKTIKSLKSSRLSMKSTNSPKLCSMKEQSESNKFRTGMELFHNAKAVRLRSHHDKYLLADEDEESVNQDRKGSSKTARWTVEFVAGSESIIRLKSCHGRYLTASNQPFLLGMTGRKVLQTLPKRLDSSVEWEPVREGSQVKLKTRYGNYLRANGGLPPWRNSVTHDVPHRTATQDWILWDVDIVEIEVRSPAAMIPPPPVAHSDSMGSDTDSSTPSSLSFKSANFSRQESNDSFTGSPPKSEGRTIHYHIAGDDGAVEGEGYSLTFKGNGVEELTRKLEEETGLGDIVVCSRSPLNGKLYPLRLQLPPNNATMQVVVVESSSRVARDFVKPAVSR